MLASIAKGAVLPLLLVRAFCKPPTSSNARRADDTDAFATCRVMRTRIADPTSSLEMTMPTIVTDRAILFGHLMDTLRC